MSRIKRTDQSKRFPRRCFLCGPEGVMRPKHQYLYDESNRRYWIRQYNEATIEMNQLTDNATLALGNHRTK